MWLSARFGYLNDTLREFSPESTLRDANKIGSLVKEEFCLAVLLAPGVSAVEPQRSFPPPSLASSTPSPVGLPQRPARWPTERPRSPSTTSTTAPEYGENLLVRFLFQKCIFQTMNCKKCYWY